MSRPWSARPAGARDRDDLRRLFEVCFRKRKGADTFAWKYDRNPDGPALGRVACDGAGRVVGAYAYVPRRFRRDGRDVLLHQASDAMVDPGARRQGIFRGLDDLVAEEAAGQGVPFAFAWSGRLSYTGFLQNGWRSIGEAPLLRYRYRAGRSLRRRGRLGPLLALAAPLLDARWSRRDARRLEGAGPLGGLARLSRFDEQADALFEAVAPARGWIGVRDARWLQWRYVDTPTGRQECYALREGEGPLLGWLVAELHEGHAYLVDHLAVDEAARARLLLGFTALAHARGMHEATALLCDHHPAVPALAALGWERPVQRLRFRDMFPFLLRRCAASADPADEDLRRWWLADGDRDAEHMSP